jgi:hypothetical protein
MKSVQYRPTFLGNDMARTNIEEGFWPRCYKLAEYLGVRAREVAGPMLMLYHESQDILAIEGTREEILLWANLYDLKPEEQARWLTGMVWAKFLTSTDKGYAIRGNEHQIDNIVKKTARAAKGGEATKRKWDANKRAAAGSDRASSLPEVGKEQAASEPLLGSIQFNSDQFNSKEEEGSGPPEKNSALPPGELTSVLIQHILESRQVHAALLWIYLDQGAPDDWLASEIRKFEVEFSASKEYSPLPYHARLRMFIDAHWPAERKRRGLVKPEYTPEQRRRMAEFDRKARAR